MRYSSVFLAITTVLAGAAAGTAETIHVPSDQPTIQAGIDAAADGDTVLVADGTYTGDGNRNIVFLGKAILVESENGPEHTILDCQGGPSNQQRGFVFENGETHESVLRGLTVINGYAVAPSPYTVPPIGCGGGILCRDASSPSIEDCVIRDCTSENFGGGIHAYGQSSPVIANCSFENNSALALTLLGGVGGGISVYQRCDAEITGCTVSGNYAEHKGGGIAVNFTSSPSIEDCVVRDNEGGGILSGGLAHWEGCSPLITGCTIIRNSSGSGIALHGASPIVTGNWIRDNAAGYGGGIYIYRGAFTVEDNEIRRNSASQGGGIHVDTHTETSGTIRNCRLVNNSSALGAGLRIAGIGSILIEGCTIAMNTSDWEGGGIYLQGNHEFLNCTILGNSAAREGGGVLAEFASDPEFTNCILRECTPDVIHPDLLSDPVVTYSNVEGGWEGEGNIDADPLFILPDENDYRLLRGSPCIDTGDPGMFDDDGTRSDMGAHPFDQNDYLTVYLTPDELWAAPGGLFGVTCTVINRWSWPQTCWGTATVTVPGGSQWIVMEPARFTVPAESTAEIHMTHDIPAGAPGGDYEYRAGLGLPPGIVFGEDGFRFLVVR